jgi:hypothetical protein
LIKLKSNKKRKKVVVKKKEAKEQHPQTLPIAPPSATRGNEQAR